MGALFTASHLGAKAIVALTESGSTALWMSRHKVSMPIYAVTSKLAAQRKMALYRGVRPLLMDTSADRDTALQQAEQHLKQRGIVQGGDVYAITCGEPMGTRAAPTCSRSAARSKARQPGSLPALSAPRQGLLLQQAEARRLGSRASHR